MYSKLSSATLIRRFKTALEIEDYHDALALFRQAVDTLDTQLFKIRTAHDALFEYDLDKSSLEIDSPWDCLSLEHVKWDEQEPNYDVENEEWVRPPSLERNDDSMESEDSDDEDDEDSDGGNGGDVPMVYPRIKEMQ